MDTALADSYDEMVEQAWRGVLPTDSEIRSARGRLHRKASTIALLLAVSYLVLVVSNEVLLVRLIAAALLVLGLVALGTSVMHDANHGSFSRHRWVNRTLAYTSDVLGASSWLWRIQHNRLHHGNTNVLGFDADLELAPWARLAPAQKLCRRYRWQHLYIWPLYGFLTVKNVFVSDTLSLLHRRIGRQPLPQRVTAGVVAGVAAGKLSHVTWAIAVPLMFNPWQAVFAMYVVCAWLVGFVLAVIFQLAHCVEESDIGGLDIPRRGDHFAAHQMRTTVDIASPTPVIGHLFRWIAGGLDHQIEHHLAPGLPHTIYPELAERFRVACTRDGIRYHLHTSALAAIGSHTRWLRTMGRA